MRGMISLRGKIRHVASKSTGTWFSREVQWFHHKKKQWLQWLFKDSMAFSATHPHQFISKCIISRNTVPADWWLIAPVGACWDNMMTSSNGNIFRVTGPCHRWIPLTKASDAELRCFLWSAPEQTVRGAGHLRSHRAHYDVIMMNARHSEDEIRVPFIRHEGLTYLSAKMCSVR